VFLHHPQSSTGGLNHYLLPFGGGANSARFADVANEALLQRFRVLGIEARSLRAKVFGGARMGMIKSDLAAKNIEAAFEFCKRIGVPVVSSDVGGERGRKLLLRISDGAAWIRLL
jgi:chemotaxis protein CheD